MSDTSPVTVTMPAKYWRWLQKQVQDADYCYLCDQHPSHGHRPDCPLK